MKLKTIEIVSAFHFAPAGTVIPVLVPEGVYHVDDRFDLEANTVSKRCAEVAIAEKWGKKTTEKPGEPADNTGEGEQGDAKTNGDETKTGENTEGEGGKSNPNTDGDDEANTGENNDGEGDEKKETSSKQE